MTSDGDPRRAHGPTFDQQANGWAAMWRKAATQEHGSRILAEATRLGQRPACLAGLIRSTK